MRYRLIDAEQLEILVAGIDNIGYKDCLQADVDSVVLSEEETLAKFKEIWECGATRGNDIDFDGWRPEYQELINKYWEEFKKEL